jgi:hypothetical protein
MMERKELGKIKSATFGMGGYQECQIGLWLTLGGESWGVTAGEGAWGIERSDHCKWTEADRLTEAGKAAMKLAKLLQTAHRYAVQDLVGLPVEVTFDGNVLKDWRLLTEVL